LNGYTETEEIGVEVFTADTVIDEKGGGGGRGRGGGGGRGGIGTLGHYLPFSCET